MHGGPEVSMLVELRGWQFKSSSGRKFVSRSLLYPQPKDLYAQDWKLNV